jgi:hypothetical protein
MFLERDALWLPSRIRNIPISKRRMSHILEKMYAFARKVDTFSRPRLVFLTRGVALKLAAAAGLLLAAATIVFGFVPLMDIALMLPVACFGLGICTQDGLVTGIGWALLGGGVGVAGFLI